MARAEQQKLWVRVLGGVELRARDASLPTPRGRKTQALLACLALSAGKPCPRRKLMSLLWSGRGQEQARASLRTALAELRRALGEPSPLVADNEMVALDPALVTADAVEFERLLGAGRLAEACALYGGALFDGVAVSDAAFAKWLVPERQRLQGLFTRALAEVMEQADRDGDREAAAEAAERLLQQDPLHEPACRTLMLVLAERGQRSRALTLYDGLRERLRQQGAEPEPATVEVDERIRQGGTASLSPHTAVELGTKPSIAVLPFLDLGGDPAQQHFGDGVSEDIITELSRFPTLLVIARNSSFRYRGGAVDLQRVGRELGVRFVAEGSVRRLGGRIRISAQLIEAASGNHLWASHYDCDMAEVADVQDEIVRAIATTLGYRVEAAGRARSLRQGAEALSAHDLVLRSEALLLRHAKEDNAEAGRLAERAIALDPTNALAHVQLGWSRFMEFSSGWVDGRREALEAAFAHAQRAVLLDEANCRARWLLGNLHLYRREFDAARDQLHAAMELNPNDVEARGIYGLYLVCTGNPTAALEQFDLAKRLNPFEFNWAIWYRGIALFTARRHDEAVATLRRVHNPINEVRLWLAASLAAAGSTAAAGAALAQFLDMAEREMARFPGRDLAGWRPYLGGFIEYRDLADLEHLLGALRAAGLR